MFFFQCFLQIFVTKPLSLRTSGISISSSLMFAYLKMTLSGRISFSFVVNVSFSGCLDEKKICFASKTSKKLIKITAPSFFVSFSMNAVEIASSQSSEVYDFMSLRICEGVSEGQISQMLSTSASDFRDCIKSAASVRDADGVITVSDCES